MTGSPLSRDLETVLPGREGEHYEVDAKTGCWNWLKAKNKAGYPFSYRHRVFWEAVNGPRPKGFHIHHKCRNTGCVNPAHMEAVAPEDHWYEHSLDKRLLSVEEGALMRELAKDPAWTYEALQEQFGCSSVHVADVLMGRRFIRELGNEVVRPEGRICRWCGGEIPQTKRRHARFCCKDHQRKFNSRRQWERTLAKRAAA